MSIISKLIHHLSHIMDIFAIPTWLIFIYYTYQMKKHNKAAKILFYLSLLVFFFDSLFTINYFSNDYYRGSM